MYFDYIKVPKLRLIMQNIKSQNNYFSGQLMQSCAVFDLPKCSYTKTNIFREHHFYLSVSFDRSHKDSAVFNTLLGSSKFMQE